MPPSVLSQFGAHCARCCSFFKWLPVLFITSVIAWSYYAYVIQLCFLTVQSIVQRIFYLIVYHAILAIFYWAYWKTIFTDIGTVPNQFKLPPSEAEKLGKDANEDNQRRLLESFARDLPVYCRTMNGAIRYCEKCRHIKPDRAHHCSVCGVCVLKMDHHCPWVNNCVSFTNYKFFILFLGYALLYCLFIASTSVEYFILFWTNSLSGLGKFHILFLFFVSMMFAFSLVSLFIYHCYLVSVNRSTLESFRHPIFRSGPDKDGFSLGISSNFVQVFGKNRLMWFLPIYTSLGDGIVFPTRTQVGSSYNSMGSTEQPSGDTITFPQRIQDDDTDGLLNQQQCWSEDVVYDDQGLSPVVVDNGNALHKLHVV